MTTKLLAKPGPVSIVSAVKPASKRGRPARPWLRAYVSVPHPVQSRLDTSVPQATVALWTGKSRQTVARWAAEGHITVIGSNSWKIREVIVEIRRPASTSKLVLQLDNFGIKPAPLADL